MSTVAIKDPGETKGYTFDLSPWLNDLGVTIASVSSVEADAGLTVEVYANTTTKITPVVSGGTDGTSYKVKATFVTSNGYILVATLVIPVQAK